MTGEYGHDDIIYSREITPGQTRDERKITTKPGYQELRKKRAEGNMKASITKEDISNKLSVAEWRSSIKTTTEMQKTFNVIPKSSSYIIFPDTSTTNNDMPLKESMLNSSRFGFNRGFETIKEHDTHFQGQKRHFRQRGPLSVSQDFTNFSQDHYQTVSVPNKERVETARYERTHNGINDASRYFY